MLTNTQKTERSPYTLIAAEPDPRLGHEAIMAVMKASTKPRQVADICTLLGLPGSYRGHLRLKLHTMFLKGKLAKTTKTRRGQRLNLYSAVATTGWVTAERQWQWREYHRQHRHAYASPTLPSVNLWKHAKSEVHAWDAIEEAALTCYEEFRDDIRQTLTLYLLEGGNPADLRHLAKRHQRAYMENSAFSKYAIHLNAPKFEGESFGDGLYRDEEGQYQFKVDKGHNRQKTQYDDF